MSWRGIAGHTRVVRLIPTSLQKVLAGLRSNLSSKAEDAHRDRDEADRRNKHEDKTYAAGEAHAYGEAEEVVRDAQREAE